MPHAEERDGRRREQPGDAELRAAELVCTEPDRQSPYWPRRLDCGRHWALPQDRAPPVQPSSGPMADAVTHSTSHLTDADLRAIAVYLKDLPPGGGVLPPPVSAQDPAMQQGQAVSHKQC